MKGRILTEKIIGDFSCCLKSEEKSENTIGKYLRDVQAFAAYLGGAAVTKEAVLPTKTSCFPKTMPCEVSTLCWRPSTACSHFLGGQIAG